MPENVDDAKGKVKEAAGDLTDDESLKNEGKVDQATGKVKERSATRPTRSRTSSTRRTSHPGAAGAHSLVRNGADRRRFRVCGQSSRAYGL